MLITPQNFEGVRRADYIAIRIQDAALGEQVYQYSRNAIAAKPETAQKIGAEIKEILDESGKAVLLTEIRSSVGMHAVGIGFDKGLDNNVNAIYLDSTGNKIPKKFMPFIENLIEGAGLRGKTTLETGIQTQQHANQPNTCLLWLTKNTCDFLNSIQIVNPKSTEEADTLISNELDRYLEFEKTTKVDPKTELDAYMRFINS